MASVNDAWSGFVQQNILVASASGNIGIGTSSPTSLQGGLTGLGGRVLQIQNSSGMAQLDVSAAGAGNVAALGFEVSDATGTPRFFQQLFDGANNVFKFRALNESTGAITQDNILALKNTGNVGIGITSPLYSLDVNGGANSFRAKAATVSGNDAIATLENSSAIQMIVRGNGYVGIGTTAPSKPLDVVGDINASGTITGGNIKAKYQDVAEWVESPQELSAGTVVVLDSSRSNQVIAATAAYDSRVAGVISLRPGLALGEEGEGRVLVATTGRVTGQWPRVPLSALRRVFLRAWLLLCHTTALRCWRALWDSHVF